MIRERLMRTPVTSDKMMTHSLQCARLMRAATLCLMAGALFGCSDPQVILPASLQGPVAMAVADGDVCLQLATISDDGLLGATIAACRKPDDAGEIVRERGAFGLVANMNEDRLAVMALNRTTPTLVDLDLSTPGVTHITVGRRPMGVGVSPDGTVAYSMNQLDQDVSVVNLWAMRAQPEPLKLPGIPTAMGVQPRSGHVVVGVVGSVTAGVITAGSSLQIHPGVRCAAPAVLPVDVGEVDPESGCEGADAAWESVPLEGTLKDVAIDPVIGHAYVIYADNPWMSVVALTEGARDGEACLEGGQAPCEVARIGMTYECSDGIDNDGDGLTDQEDVQCFSPLGAESQGGVGVRAMAACADGLDGDGDGLIDRNDPACRVASQTSEDEAAAPNFDATVAVCGDGVDNDADGLIDELDPDCYGSQGRREEAVAAPGVTSVSVDEQGLIAYVLSPVTNAVLIVDLKGRRVLQSSKIASTTNPFAQRLGVAISNTVAPTAVNGTITRTVTRDPRVEYAASHALIDYDLGAYVTGDNGFIYYVDVATIACDVWETQGLLDEATFFLEPEQLAGRQESRCLVVPDELRSDQLDVAPSCEEFLLCRSCLRERGDAEFDACVPCDRYIDQDSYLTTGAACELDERVEQEGLLTRVFNPRFVVRDAASTQDAGQAGSAQCTQPDALINALSQSIQLNPMGPQVAGCGSPLVQQPLSVTVPLRGADVDDYVTSQRVDVPEQRSVRLLMDTEGAVTTQLVIDTEDFVVRDEDWSMNYEGVLPGTRRGDGILANTAGVLDIGTLDPCVSDVRVGDALILLSEPGSVTDGVPAGCEAFQTPAQFSGDAWREYEVLEVKEDSLVFGVKANASGIISTLPSEECFARGIDYEVRASDAWLVTGSSSGIASGQIARDGVCVPGNGASAPRVQSRVRGGERFVGPGLSFWMTQGVVAPVRDSSYLVNVTRNFSAASTPSRLSINASTPAPTEVHFERLYSAVPDADGVWPVSLSRKQVILVVEPADNSIIVREPFGNAETNVVR